MPSLLVGAKTNLVEVFVLAQVLIPSNCLNSFALSSKACKHVTYRWHDHLTLEPSPHTIVDTLGLSPARVDTLVGVTLMSMEALRAC